MAKTTDKDSTGSTPSTAPAALPPAPARDVLNDATDAEMTWQQALDSVDTRGRRMVAVRLLAQVYDPATRSYRGWLGGSGYRVNLTPKVETGARFTEAFDAFIQALTTHGTLGVLQALRQLQSGKAEPAAADAGAAEEQE